MADTIITMGAGQGAARQNTGTLRLTCNGGALSQSQHLTFRECDKADLQQDVAWQQPCDKVTRHRQS